VVRGGTMSPTVCAFGQMRLKSLHPGRLFLHRRDQTYKRLQPPRKGTSFGRDAFRQARTRASRLKALLQKSGHSSPMLCVLLLVGAASAAPKRDFLRSRCFSTGPDQSIAPEGAPTKKWAFMPDALRPAPCRSGFSRSEKGLPSVAMLFDKPGQESIAAEGLS
jgi:hypothetical protein